MIRSRLAFMAVLVGLVHGEPLSGQGSLDGSVRLRGQPAAGAVVWLASRAGEPGRFPADTVVVDQTMLRFEPRVVALPLGGTVRFLNSDPIMHNVFSPTRRGAGFDLGTYPQYESRDHTFEEPGTFVVLCHVHPEMSAWVVVTETGLHDVADDAGVFHIETVLAGEYDLQVWYRGSTATATIRVPEEGLAGLTLEVTRRD